MARRSGATETQRPATASLWFRIALAVVVIGASLTIIRLGGGLVDSRPAASEFSCPAYRPLPPVGGGVVRAVSDQNQLAAALKSAGPGDTINLKSGVYQEIHFRPAYGHRSGTSSAPIVIQAAAGATPIIDGDNLDDPARKAAVLVANTSHVMVRGLEVRNRFFGAMSWGSSAVTFEHNDVHSVGHSAVIANAHRDGGALTPSSNVIIRCNRIHRTGLLEPEFGEGIYIGTGIHDLADTTNNVLIEGNEIFDVSNEAIDVKHHVTNVTIRHNRIHDANPFYGGAISLGLNKHHWGPANYTVEHNQIWNIKSGLYYGQAIAVAHGPTTIRNNKIWAVETNESDSWPWTAVVQVHGDDNTAEWAYGFGNAAANTVEIIDNVIVGCGRSCIDSTIDPGEIQPKLVVSGNIVDAPSTGSAATGNDRLVTATDFVGPLAGDADAGSGPGSGLELNPEPEPERSPATTEPPSPAIAAPPSSLAVAVASAPEATSAREATSTLGETSPPTTVDASPLTAEEGLPTSTTAAVAVPTPRRSSTTTTGPEPTVVPARRAPGERDQEPLPPHTAPRTGVDRGPAGQPSSARPTPPAGPPQSQPLATASIAGATAQVAGSDSMVSGHGEGSRRAPRRPVPGPRAGRQDLEVGRPTTTIVAEGLSSARGGIGPSTTVPSKEGPPAIIIRRSEAWSRENPRGDIIAVGGNDSDNFR